MNAFLSCLLGVSTGLLLLDLLGRLSTAESLLLLLYGSESGGWMQSSSLSRTGKGKRRISKRGRSKKRTMNGVEPQIMIVMVVRQLLPPVGLFSGFLHRTAAPFL